MMSSRVLPEKKRVVRVPVYLNVYDLTTINGYAYWLGLGVYHSGVQVHGVEYAFGAHEHTSTGVFEVEPKHCPGFTFRKSVLIGRTDMGLKDVRDFMENISQEYGGNTYNLITRNCNHFCDDVCTQLTGKHIPSWVNRMARLGLFCNCVLPASINETKIKQERLDGKAILEDEKEKPRRLSTVRHLPTLPAQAVSSSSKSNSKENRCLPAPSWLMLPSSKFAKF